MYVRKYLHLRASALPAFAAASVVALICLTEAVATAQTLPSPWISTDIGNPPAAGGATESGGRFTILASGADIWGTSDQFHFLYQPVTGDVDVVARIDSLVNVDVWSKAGVMIRSSLAPGSAHAYALVSAGKGLAFQRRRIAGGVSYNSSGALNVPPRWTRLVRKGTTVTAYVSADGSAWTSLGSDTIALGSTAYVGVAVTSHASGLTTAVASQVAVYPLNLPTGFQTADVGSPTPQGSAVYQNGVFTVRGAGADIWDTHDQFRFVYRQVTGDMDVRTRVASLQAVSSWTKAGVMIRETLNAGSRHAISLVSSGKGYAFQRRIETAGLSSHTSGGTGQAPGWVRLVRTGSQIAAYRSTDGVTWTLIGTDTISMAASVYVGLALSSHVDGTLAQGVFDNVSIIQTGTANVPPSVSLTAPSSGATFTAPANTTVSAAATDSDGQVTRVDFLANNSLIGSDTTSPYSMSWSSIAAGTYSLVAVAYDNAGANTASAAVGIKVGTTLSPWSVAFTASPDHATVTRYVLEIFTAGANPATATAVATSDLGKPTPSSTNEIVVDRTTFFTGLAAGNYIATVRAENSAGFSRSAATSFTR